MVLTDRLVPGIGVRREVLMVALGTVLVALCSRMEVPLQPVPITGQTFGVLLVGALLGARRGAQALAGYLGLGVAGLPLFATGAPGIAHLLGPTGGYLIGFVAAAWLVGWLSERGWDRHVVGAAAAMILGNLVIYAAGSAWLAGFVGPSKVFALGIAPFLFGDALKVALAALLLPTAWRFAGRASGGGR
jgi:biotin transport system substrate-specific component